MLDHALQIQMTYGAVMLSFLGALHWGFEFAGYGGQQGYVPLYVHPGRWLTAVAWRGVATAA